jgi:hypothetical protein
MSDPEDEQEELQPEDPADDSSSEYDDSAALAGDIVKVWDGGISVDMDGSRFCGLFVDWDYENCKVHVSIPGYVETALKRFKHPTPEKPQHQPHPHNPKQYGQKQQYVEAKDESPLLGKEDKNSFRR